MQTSPWNKVTASNAEEMEAHRWVTEASYLRIPPGHIPTQLDTTLGNGQPFMLREFESETWWYQQANGCLLLKVFND